MSFAAESAAAKLQAKLGELNEVFPSTAMELQNAHLYSDALIALRQANGCRLEEAVRAMVMVGMAVGEGTDVAVKYIESPNHRMHYHDVVFEMLALTEGLVAQALVENCACQGSDQPAPLIADLLRP